MKTVMKRREFFSRLIPGKSQKENVSETVQQKESLPKTPMSENEQFLRAMALGIDPATITPGQLEKLVSE